jgi:DNA-binding response OmpR family regulator
MSSPRILVVDDDPSLRQLIQWTLEDEGWAVDTAADGRQALDRAARERPRLVVLDMGLPLVDGFGVAAGLHALYGDAVPIVVITADGQAAAKAARVGARAHLAKPFELDDLCALVRGALPTA